MKQYLDLILKKKKYINELKLKKEELEKELELQRVQTRKCNTDMANLYIELNQYQLIDQESSIVSSLVIVSIVLFVLSILLLYTLVQMGFPVLSVFAGIFAFDISEFTIFLGASKIVKKHFKNKRLQNIKITESLWKQINDLGKKCFNLEKECSILRTKIQEFTSIICREEQDVQLISNEIINFLLNLTQQQNNKNLDYLIHEEIEKEPQIELDLDMKRTLNHLEDK